MSAFYSYGYLEALIIHVSYYFQSSPLFVEVRGRFCEADGLSTDESVIQSTCGRVPHNEAYCNENCRTLTRFLYGMRLDMINCSSHRMEARNRCKYFDVR